MSTTAPLPPRPAAGQAPAPASNDRRWHYRRSLASRVTLLATIAVGATVAVLSVSVYLVVRVQLLQTADQQLVDRANSVVLTSGNVASLVVEDESGLRRVDLAEFRIAYLRSDGRLATHPLVSGPDALPWGQEQLDVAQGRSSKALQTVSIDNQSFRLVAVPANGGALLVAQNLGPQQQFLNRLGLAMILFGVAGVMIAAIGGTVVARNGLRPVRRLTDSVEHIARTEDLTHLPIEGDDEVARLAAAFNQMLTALDASRVRQRQLVADAGHELKTPLTSLRTNLDLLAQAEDGDGSRLPAESRRELIEDVRAQTVELSTLIGDLVELARDEPLRPVVGPVPLLEVLDRAVARVRLRAPSLTFTVRAAPWWVVGEEHALERAVTNLLDNAAKWSPPGGTVTATLANGILTVDDEGSGIAEEDRPHVFDRFYRATDSRGMPGSGLGLSIVRQAAERHAGTVTAGATPSGGARLTLSLPGSPVCDGDDADEAAPPPAAEPSRWSRGARAGRRSPGGENARSENGHDGGGSAP